MNKLATTSLLAALGGFCIVPAPARADGDKALAAIGGFIGGMIVGSATRDRCPPPPPREYCPPPVVVRHGPQVVIEAPRFNCGGYYRWSSVRVWVPGRWVVSFDHHGRRCSRYVEGYYDYRRERVWTVCHDSHPHHSHADACDAGAYGRDYDHHR